MQSRPRGALADLTIVEIGESIAVAYAGKLFAELGARVIRVDPLSGGDLYRSAPLVGRDVAGLRVGAPYLHLNRGKQSIGLDLAADGGQDVLSRLLEEADVFIAGLEPRLDGPPEAWLQRFPRLVVTIITPFGLTGPYRELAASDLVVMALGGLLYMVGFPDRQPLQLGGSQPQYAAGLSAFSGAMAAVTYRKRSGQGQLIDVSMLETVAFMEWKSGTYYESDGRVRRRVGDHADWFILEASDGYVGLVYFEPDWPMLRKLTGIDALTEERFASRAERIRRADELRDVLAPWFKARRKQQIYHEAQAAGIPLGFIATVEDLIESDQYRVREFWETINHPATGPVTYPGVPYHWSGVALHTSRAPIPGEHTHEILTTVAGYSDEQLDRLRCIRAV